MLRSYSEEDLSYRFNIDNPWWVNSSIDEDIRAFRPRLYLPLILKLIKTESPRRATILMGQRRVGKTILLYHCIQNLIEGGVDPQKICYLSLDTPIYSNVALEKLMLMMIQKLGQTPEGCYIFFDEIQYLPGWENHLKSLVDTYRSTTFIVSGSASATLKRQSKESGAGRFTDFHLPPLGFYEYVQLKEQAALFKDGVIAYQGRNYEFQHPVDIKAINQQFIDYLNYGGYPEMAFSKTIQDNPQRYVRSDIIDKVLQKDLPALYGIHDIQELNRLFSTLAYNAGQIIKLNTLGKEAQLAESTIKRYLEYLEAAFLIKKVQRIDFSAKRFKRENNFKAYLTNPSLWAALFRPISNEEDQILEKLVENALMAQLFGRVEGCYYANWKNGKVDMVLTSEEFKPRSLIEVKWSDRIVDNSRELKSLLSFATNNKMQSAFVSTISKIESKKIKEVQVQFVPAAVLAYNSSRLTFVHHSHKPHF